jgi:hypothetical protein
MADTKFKKGEGGRPKGASNKTTRLVKEVFADVFAQLQNHETANLKAWAEQEPTEFYKLASKLIPTQVDATVNQNVNLLTLDPLSTTDDTSNNGASED